MKLCKMSNVHLGRKKKSPICGLGLKGSSCKPHKSPQEEQEAKREWFLGGRGSHLLQTLVKTTPRWELVVVGSLQNRYHIGVGFMCSLLVICCVINQFQTS